MQIDRPASRRTVLAGAAWSAPAIVVASAVPAYAGSTPTVTPIVLDIAAVMTDAGPRITVGFGNAAMRATSGLVRLVVSITQLSGNRTFTREEPAGVTDWSFAGTTGDGTTTYTRQGLLATQPDLVFTVPAPGTGASSGRVVTSATASGPNDASFTSANGTYGIPPI